GRFLRDVAGGTGEGGHPVAGGERVRAAEPLVPSALQPRAGACAVPSAAPAARPQWDRRARAGPPAGYDSVPRRGAVDPRKIRGGAEQARPHEPDARGGLSRPGLRMGLRRRLVGPVASPKSTARGRSRALSHASASNLLSRSGPAL